MQKINVLCGLTIIYNETEKEKIKIIKEFINKYDFLFTDFKNGTNKIKISIDKFNELVENIVKEFVNSKDIKQSLESKDFLPSCYILYLIIKNDKEKNSLIKLPKNMTMELLQFLFSIKYYNYDTEKVYKTLLSNDLESYNKIFEQMKTTHRVDAYNYYLKCASGFLEEYDPSMLDNLESIIEKLTQKNFEYIQSLSSQQSKLDNLRQLSKDEFDKLFITFLNYINAPKEWYDYYEHIKSNNLIKFEYSTDIENGECYFDSDIQEWIINLISDGTIRTFVTFVHEFVHYVSFNKNKNINFSLLEFPTIYFENIATEFLKESGYEEGIIDEVLNDRNANNFKLYGSQILQFKDILSYKKNGPFSIERRIEFYRNWIKSMNDFKIEMVKVFKDSGVSEIPDFLQTLEERNPAEIAYQEIDEEINGFVESGLLILNGYQYLVGSLLSFSILDTTDRKLGNQKLIDIINRLDNHSISSIIQLFNIDLSTKEDSLKNNEYQKELLFNPTNS